MSKNAWALLGVAAGMILLLAWNNAHAAESAFAVGAILFQLR